MKHQRSKRTLGRVRKQRTALIRGLALSLIERGRISTTAAKAKELRPYIERIVTKAKSETIASRRLVSSRLGEPSETMIKKLFGEIAPKYKARNGGYTRIVKMGRSKAGRDEAVIEFV